jgi:erythromycin esterase-like protein
MRVEDDYVTLVLRRSFDALIFIERIRASDKIGG